MDDIDHWTNSIAKALAALAITTKNQAEIPSTNDSLETLRRYHGGHDADMVESSVSELLMLLDDITHRYGIDIDRLYKSRLTRLSLGDYPPAIPDPDRAKRRAMKLQRLRDAANRYAVQTQG